jgi:hypothetical protein
MSEVTVSFFGICTHVKVGDVNPTTHRVILPHVDLARIGQSPALERQSIKPHVARLQIYKRYFEPLDESLAAWFAPEPGYRDDVSVWRLDRVALRIEGAWSDGPSGDPACIPHLRDYCCSLPDLREGYGTANGPSAPADAACIFDFPDVTPVGRRIPVPEEPLRFGATAGIITVSAPDAPMLSVWRDEKENGRIQLRSGARITVSSYPDETPEGVDKDADFLLHFLSMTEVPARSWFPPAPPWEQCPPGIPEDDLPVVKNPLPLFTGPGCSNSNYP